MAVVTPEQFVDQVEDLMTAGYALACKLVGMQEAEDVVQDAYVKDVQSLDSFRGDAQLRSWFLRIVRNACYDAAKQTKRMRLRRREFGEWMVLDETLGYQPEPADIESVLLSTNPQYAMACLIDEASPANRRIMLAQLCKDL